MSGETVESLPIASILRHKAFQVRAKLDDRTLLKYETVLRSDGTLPPVKVGRIVPESGPRIGRPLKTLADVPEDSLVLLDGYHRVEAHRAAGVMEIEAIVVDVTAREALWESAKANLTHGLPLKPREVRVAFKAYVRAGQWRDANRKPKSLRLIGREFGKPHQTVTGWLKADPDLKWLLLKYTTDPHEGAGHEIIERDSMFTLANDIADQLSQATTAAAMLTPEQRWELREKASALLAKLDSLGTLQPEF